MLYQRPLWADALKNALAALSNQHPRPLLPMIELMSGVTVTALDLGEFVSATLENDPTLTQARITLAKWDADLETEFIGEDGTPTLPRTPARRAAIYLGLNLDGPTADAFDNRIPMFEAPVIVISKAFEPWYREARKSRTSVYWDDYERHLRDTKLWSAEAISSLDQTTTELIERLSDPTRTTVKQTKGLVVGYVQSGKTANFTGVVAKAVDAGYRLIIVLTGTIEILRAQTQRRMDMELIGVENILRGLDPSDPQVAKELDYQTDNDWLADRFLRHGTALELPNVVHIDRVTTHHSDYKRLPQGLTKLKFHKIDKQKPLNDPTNLFGSDAYVAIVKKNSAPLQKLIKDLTPIKNDLGQLPVLVIDDESDQASVDTTNPDKWDKKSKSERERTAINKLITNLLALCPRAQYVGYTATPFANVFVDPDDERDLFPSDFVLSLYRPPGYMGVREFHDVGARWDDEEQTIANSNELAHVRELVGDSKERPNGRIQELQEALDAWVLSGAIKKYRENKGSTAYRHHTMLVHESVKKDAHLEAATDIRELWALSKFASAQGLTRLRGLYDRDYLPVMQARAGDQPVPSSFEELKPFVATALAEMTIDGDPVLVVNSDKEVQAQQKKLDFEGDKVWRILVGGTQLSRGFTVEGLTISYFRRKAGQADTLMQAGRWFGFRPGYQDLVRLYIRRDETVDLYDAFEALLLDEEAFREELRQYEGFDDDGLPMVEPRQIPPLVSQHLPWLKPTARNKMWNAVIDSKATAGGFQDRYGIPPRGDKANTRNLENVGIPLVAQATESISLPYALKVGSKGEVDFKVGVLGAEEFLALFGQMEWDERYIEAVRPLRKFLDTSTGDGRIQEWLVAWPQPSKPAGSVELGGLGGSAPVVKRSRRSGRIDFIGSDDKHRQALLPVCAGLDVKGIKGSGGRGVALIYLVDDRPEAADGSKIGELSRANVVPLISLAAPLSATPRRRDFIQWTVRVQSKQDDAAVDKDGS